MTPEYRENAIVEKLSRVQGFLEGMHQVSNPECKAVLSTLIQNCWQSVEHACALADELRKKD